MAAPAGPAPGVAYAGFWIRFAAHLIDLVIIWIPLGIAVGFLIGPQLGTLDCALVTVDGVQHAQCSNLGALSGSLLIVEALGLVVPLIYFVVLWGWRSQSIGQQALGLRIVDVRTGARISLGRALLRYVGYIVSSIPFSLGLMWAGWDPQKQGWHDKIASTFVIRRL